MGNQEILILSLYKMKIEKRIYKIVHKGKQYSFPVSVFVGVEPRKKVPVRSSNVRSPLSHNS